jgi:hypothetical protein
MRKVFAGSMLKGALLLLVSVPLGGCASLISSAATNLADNLSTAILNQDDPELVRAGAPSYLLLLDSFIEGNPDDPDILSAAATLYATYGAVFADDDLRASRLTTRARGYALAAMCESYAAACDWSNLSYDDFARGIAACRGIV